MEPKTSRHKRVIPRAFCLPFTSEDGSGAWTCFTYAIRFKNFKSGTDPIQHSASEFLLLSPQVLDEEASNLSVRLNLPAFASVEAYSTYCGVLHISCDKVDLVKRFNIWLFHLALGKCFALPNVAGNGIKNYYVLPCQPVRSAFVQSPDQLIDWKDVEVAVNSSLLYRSKVHFFNGCAKLETRDSSDDHVPEIEGLRMRNGTFGEDELEDAIVTCANNGLPCYIGGILHEVSGNSICPRAAGRTPITYSENYIQKCKYKLQYPNQPLLKGYRLVRAGNYVRRSSAVSNGDAVKPWETMELPPEVCILHVGLKGKLCRGAMRLPSILHSLEMSLVAAELRNNIGPSFSCFKVQEALTSGACEGDSSYETLELLGDSVLNFVGGVHMYIDHPSFHSEELHALRHEIVSNRSLYKCGLACGLSGYVFAELLNPKTWVPPGPALEDLPQKLEGQIIGLKTLADVVEALVGVYLLQGNLDLALAAINWLQVPLPFPSKVPGAILEAVEDQIRIRNPFDTHDIVTLEKKIHYQFRHKFLLISAFDFGNQVTSNKAGIPIGGFDFQRLEFLGDSVLDFLITRNFVQLYPRSDPKQLNNLRQATVNSENFACLAIHHGLHHYLQKMSPVLRNQIEAYAASVYKEGRSPFGIPSQTSPRAVGDLMQTLAGAVLLDSNFDYDLVWKVLEPLLRPLATPETVMLHPRRQLEMVCHKQHLKLELQSIRLEGSVEARVYINQVLVATSQHDESTVARRLAALKALRSLSPKSSGLDLYGSGNDGELDVPIAALESDGECGLGTRLLRGILSVLPLRVVPYTAEKQPKITALAHPVLCLLKYFRRRQVLDAGDIEKEAQLSNK